MRTTLDIDDVVLSAARGLAHAEGISLGRAVSELAMRGLRSGAGEPSNRAPVADYSWPGFVPLPSSGESTMTTEQVKDLLLAMEEEDDLRRGLAGLE